MEPPPETLPPAPPDPPEPVPEFQLPLPQGLSESEPVLFAYHFFKTGFSQPAITSAANNARHITITDMMIIRFLSLAKKLFLFFIFNLPPILVGPA
jgi:hypothetical protein